MRQALFAGSAIVAILAGAIAPVFAKATDIKKAQALGFTDIKSCTACHTKAKGDKELNARGQFLVDKKKEHDAKEIDLNWLKDYKEK
jgi:hypothetical protein